MIKRILSGYATVFSGAARFLLLVALCFAIGFAVVYPLWRLAVSDGRLYSIIFLAILALAAAALAWHPMRRLAQRGPRACILAALRLAIPAGALALFVALVLAEKRALGFVALAVGGALFGLVAFGLGPADHRADDLRSGDHRSGDGR